MIHEDGDILRRVTSSRYPEPTNVAASAVMRGNRRRDTRPELEVRHRLHAAGLRYRVDAAPVRGLKRRADIVFSSVRVAVFIDGCYWHGCEAHGTNPQSNASYWEQKLAGNVRRDRDTDAKLTALGW